VSTTPDNSRSGWLRCIESNLFAERIFTRQNIYGEGLIDHGQKRFRKPLIRQLNNLPRSNRAFSVTEIVICTHLPGVAFTTTAWSGPAHDLKARIAPLTSATEANAQSPQTVPQADSSLRAQLALPKPPPARLSRKPCPRHSIAILPGDQAGIRHRCGGGDRNSGPVSLPLPATPWPCITPVRQDWSRVGATRIRKWCVLLPEIHFADWPSTSALWELLRTATMTRSQARLRRSPHGYPIRESRK